MSGFLPSLQLCAFMACTGTILFVTFSYTHALNRTNATPNLLV